MSIEYKKPSSFAGDFQFFFEDGDRKRAIREMLEEYVQESMHQGSGLGYVDFLMFMGYYIEPIWKELAAKYNINRYRKAIHEEYGEGEWRGAFLEDADNLSYLISNNVYDKDDEYAYAEGVAPAAVSQKGPFEGWDSEGTLRPLSYVTLDSKSTDPA